MTQERIRAEIGQGYVQTRIVPLPHLLIVGTTSGTADTFYTVNDGTLLKVSQLAAINITAGAVTLSLNAIPSGGAIGDGNAELRAVSIPANTAASLTDYIGGLYQGGAVLKAYASATNSIVIHGWAEEIR